MKTVLAYKLFRQRGDQLYPLFVNATTPTPVGVWLDAEEGPRTRNFKVKSRIGELAFRPGWHAGDMPVATHIGGKSKPGLKAPDFRPADQVWALVEMPADVEWQPIADQHKGGLPHIPYDGHYRFKTNPNMTGNWLIAGSMKVLRILSDAEVEAHNERWGVADLPRAEEVDAT